MTLEPIALDRRFLELKETGDESAERDLAALGLLKGVAWNEILRHRCVVVLGEAGTGKTTEFRQRSALLAGTGSASFFVTVEELASQGFAESLTSKLERQFETWKSSTERAYFFLDAVDEARLNGPRFKIFETALRKLERALGNDIVRAHVLISCRVSDWRAHSDRATIGVILYPADTPAVARQPEPSPRVVDSVADIDGDDVDDDGWVDRRSERRDSSTASSDLAGPAVRVYALAPLDEARVEKLAQSLGVTDPGAFTSAARRATAYSYLERPRDVEWLVAYWLQHATFGSLSELVENDVREKLIERNSDREQKQTLSSARAREAVQALAGVSILERRITFRLPDEVLDAERAAGSVDPVVILPDLPTHQLHELPSRPLFDEATYGRVRIHHRTVAEYLAAEWLRTLIENGLSADDIDALLFRQNNDVFTVPDALVPVGAWLAGSNARIRERLLEVAPIAFLQAGDPSRLPVDFRRKLLGTVARQYHSRERLFKTFDRATLGRLASNEITDTLNELLNTSLQDELLETLLTIVAEGGLHECAAEVLRLATGPLTRSHARYEAIRTLARIGTTAQLEDLLRVMVEEASEIDHEIGSALLELYPGSMSLGQLVTLLSRVKQPPQRTSTSLPYSLGGKIYRDTPLGQRAHLINAVLDMVRTSDGDIEPHRRWMLRPLVRMASRFVSDYPGEYARVLEPLMGFLARMSASLTLTHEHGEDELRKLASGQPAIRRMIFWGHVKTVRLKKPTASSFHQLLGTERLWRLRDEDREWLEVDARTQVDVKDRLMAFDTLISAPVVSGQEHTRDQMIAKLVAADDALRKRFERYPRFEPADRIEGKWQRRAKVINAKHERQHQGDLQWLHDHLTELRDGSNQRVLVHLAGKVDLDPEQPSKAVNQLIERYDNIISAATRGGWRRSWRSVRCLLPHEEEARNSFSYSMIVGLAGLALDIEDGLDLNSLGPEDAHQVARYATRGLNRFPPWINTLVTTQRMSVVKVFGKCIHADFVYQVEGPGTHNVLHLLPHASPGVREICVPIVLELLTKGNPPRVDTLTDCLEALLATPSTHEAIGRLAPSRCDFGPGKREQLSLWWCVWLGVDPVPALNRLEDAIATEPGSADDLVLVFADRLWRLAEDAQLGFAFPGEPSERARLTKIVISHVRPDDDIRHHGAHMYGPRDHAESLRRYLLDLLAGTPGREAYNGLKEIAAVPSLASWRDYLLSLAERQLGQDANARNSEVAERLINLYKKHGLMTMSHLKQAGSTGRDASAPVLIDFAIVTAIEVERRAVCSAFGLGDEHRVKEGSRVYWRGQLRLASGDAYEIVVAQAADMANIDTALATSDLLHRWTPGAALMVGIAATTNPRRRTWAMWLSAATFTTTSEARSWLLVPSLSPKWCRQMQRSGTISRRFPSGLRT